jgi:hypothetical protein
MEVCQPWSADDLRRSATRSRFGKTMNKRPLHLVSYALYETTVQLSSANVIVRRSRALDPITAAPSHAFTVLLAIDLEAAPARSCLEMPGSSCRAGVGIDAQL